MKCTTGYQIHVDWQFATQLGHAHATGNKPSVIVSQCNNRVSLRENRCWLVEEDVMSYLLVLSIVA
jgi:hypothetical protein